MINLITGIVAMVGVVVFLGNYAYKIDSGPLTIFIVVVLLAPIYDFYRAFKSQQRQDEGLDSGDDGESETVKAREPGVMKETDR